MVLHYPHLNSQESVMQKKWHSKQFRATIKDLGFDSCNKNLANRVCKFLDDEDLASPDVNIVTHMEVDQMHAVQVLVTQVFYRK